MIRDSGEVRDEFGAESRSPSTAGKLCAGTDAGEGARLAESYPVAEASAIKDECAVTVLDGEPVLLIERPPKLCPSTSRRSSPRPLAPPIRGSQSARLVPRHPAAEPECHEAAPTRVRVLVERSDQGRVARFVAPRRVSSLGRAVVNNRDQHGRPAPVQTSSARLVRPRSPRGRALRPASGQTTEPFRSFVESPQQTEAPTSTS